MPRHYCTYFDRHYLPYGIALYESLTRHSDEPFVLWVLCFDEETYHVLGQMELVQVRRIALSDFEAGDEALLEAKGNRDRVEYFWTCTPSLPLYIFRENPEIDQVTYLDADLFFYSSPEVIFEEFGDGSILVIEHRFPRELKEREIFGKFNVGLLVFRRDEEGIAALERWRDQCNEWCYRHLEGEKYGDQKYLDQWPERFTNVVILENKGAGLAPWNLSRYELSLQESAIFVDEVPLVFFHFHRFSFFSDTTFAHGSEVYPVENRISPLRNAHLELLYIPYASELRKLRAQLDSNFPSLHIQRETATFSQIWQGMSRGLLNLALNNWFARCLSRFFNWRLEGLYLGDLAYKSQESGKPDRAKRLILGAVRRRPSYLFQKRFWRIIFSRP